MKFSLVSLKALLILVSFMACQNATAAWRYEEESDPMTSAKARWAIAESINVLRFTFPYAGDQKATLQLRAHPRMGKHVIIGIDRGQFRCRIDGCTVLVRFDEGTAQKYSATEPSDGSTTYIFIREYSRFVEQLAKSKKLRIQTEFYQQGAPVLEFDVGGLKWP